ncbi:alpha/beta fold hydrolase [Streptomyces sp. TRM66268-LWL]|uniref:Alpha/beta fold hydrolase n=1 Tax=Streptomyces polyasparticus TaxID=2767826 RepID=A0ABR7SCN8_9ACTN|nr:alpha/beta fold hydrolase [Streptomyces polyasparticus]MBC9712742.1 alpha/beta fold hydrolase [Streptomyces polyasparticus]
MERGTVVIWGDDPSSALVTGPVARAPRAAVLLLHGGRENGVDAPPLWNLPGLRMRPFARAVGRAVDGHDVVVGRVRYRCRGWNGAREDPLHDARAALDALERRFGEIPTVLVGHSMGGRAALRAAGHRLVRGVVGLAPWCPEGEPVEQLAGRRVVLLHGDMDRTTDPRASAAYAARASKAGAQACLVLVDGAGHAMLQRPRTWHALTAGSVTGLLGLGPLPPVIARSSGAGGGPVRVG